MHREAGLSVCEVDTPDVSCWICGEAFDAANVGRHTRDQVLCVLTHAADLSVCPTCCLYSRHSWLAAIPELRFVAGARSYCAPFKATKCGAVYTVDCPGAVGRTDSLEMLFWLSQPQQTHGSDVKVLKLVPDYLFVTWTD